MLCEEIGYIQMAYITKVPVRVEWAGFDYVKVFVDAWDYRVPAINVLTTDLPENVTEAVMGNDSIVVVNALVDLEADSADKVIVQFEEIVPIPDDSDLFG